MTRLILTFTLFLIILPFSVFTQTNQTDLLKTLLDLPAPPPVEKNESVNKAENIKDILKVFSKFKNKTDVPADDAPIEDILTFWSLRNLGRVGGSGHRLYLKPTDIVKDRIFDEIKKKPSLLNKFFHLLTEKEHIDFGIEYYEEKMAEIKNRETNSEKPKTITSVSEAIAMAEKSQRQNNSSEYSEDYVNIYQMGGIKSWITFHSDHFSDELLKKAIKIKDKGNKALYGDELIILGKVDWEKAKPIAERLIDDKSQPFSSASAIAAYYLHFLEEKDERSASKYRVQLQNLVENRKTKVAIRKKILQLLLYQGDFEERDDWFISLLSDETLFGSKVKGLDFTFFFATNDPQKWIDTMLELLGHKNPIIHKSAVLHLVNLLDTTDEKTNKVILQALLPWLTDKNWANTTGRVKLIKKFGEAKMQESIPGLILILQNEKLTAGEVRKDAASKMRDVKKAAVDLSKLSETQKAAIEALIEFKDPRAIPALQNLLAETKDSGEQKTIISAIIACGGYNANQQLRFIEAFAKRIIIDNKAEYIENNYSRDEDEFTIDEHIGSILNDTDNPDENLVRFLIARIKTLKKSNLKLSKTLNKILQRWDSKALNIERLNSITEERADVETIIRVLTDRKALRKNHQNQIYAMRSEGGIASGIAACLLENENEILSVLNSGNLNTKIAGLACARLLRIKIPINVVSPDLNSSNKLLATAAERYLISEDSFEARRLILSKYPDEAKILGARWAFTPNKKANFDNLPIYGLFGSFEDRNIYYYRDSSLPNIDKTQKKLREEVKTNANLLGIYAFLKDSESGHQILRLYKDKAVYSWYEDEARFRERIVSQDELKQIFDYVAEYEIEDLKPIFRSCHHSCPTREFVMFGRNGGRRIFINAYKPDQPLKGLQMVFDALEQGKSKLRYHLQDKIADLEVLLDEKNIKAKSVWKNGDDFRVLVFNEKTETGLEEEFNQKRIEARKSVGLDDENYDEYETRYKQYEELEKVISQERADRKHEAYSWRKLVGNKLGDTLEQPFGVYKIRENGEFPSAENLLDSTSPIKTLALDFEVRVGNYKTEGIWKVSKNGLSSKVAKEDYENSLIVSSDGKWATAQKETHYDEFGNIFRVNLQTGKKFEIKLPNSILAKSFAYIESHNKFLIYTPGYDKLKEFPKYVTNSLKKDLKKGEFEKLKSAYYLVDPNTGSFEKVKGEFEPLSQITYRNLQKTANANEYWAAIFDEKSNSTKIGRYNTINFEFKEEFKIPEIRLDSMDIWLDEKEAKVYFIYEGHLLALPFKKNE